MLLGIFKPSSDFLLDVLGRCFFCGSFLFVMLHVCHYYAALSVPSCLMVACCGKADLLALLCVVFSFVLCHFSMCVLTRIRTWG